MLQVIITRMAGNCFAIKNWFIVSFGGLLTIYLTKGIANIMLVALLIAVAFGLWDAYYLSLERKYRQKYELALLDQTELFDMGFSDLPKPQKQRGALLSLSLVPYWMALGIAIILLNHDKVRVFVNCVSQGIYGG